MITLEELYDCAGHGSDAMRFLPRVGSKAQSDLGAYFEHILKTHPPSTWLKHFKDSGQIAFFIKYVALQDLGLAKEKYRKRIADDKDVDPLIRELFERAAKLFLAPLVDMGSIKISDGNANEQARARERSRMGSLPNTGEIGIPHCMLMAVLHRCVCSQVISSLLARAEKESTMELRLITEITARWMRRCVNKGNPPMTPHHTQVLSMLVFSSFYSKLKEARDGQKGGKKGKKAA